MNANKVIHEVLGFNWSHSWPDYTDPDHYCVLLDWLLEGDKARLFGIYTYYQGKQFIDYPFGSTRQEQVNLIAEAIEAGVFK